MNDSHDQHASPIKTPKQLITVVVAAFLVPIIGISMLAALITGEPDIDPKSSAMSPEAVAKRLRPIGDVVVADANAPTVEKTGEQVVQAVCAACHQTGALNAPKVGDKNAWAPRIAKGFDELVKNALNGINQMPPNGGNSELSDTEVARGVAHMANLSGAKFKEPAVQAPLAAKAPSAPAPGKEAKAAATSADAATAASAPTPAPVKAGSAAPAANSADGAKPAATQPAAVQKGKTVYETTCAACHASGLANAPKFGDKAAWAPRIQTGIDTLYASALHGKGAMPPKGANAALPDDNVKAAVDYMVGQAK